MVVNFDIPLMFSVGTNRHTGEANFEEYLHRVGRTVLLDSISEFILKRE